jgi:hypothetical protein
LAGAGAAVSWAHLEREMVWGEVALLLSELA